MIYDTNGAALSSGMISVPSAGNKIIEIQINCAAGYFLKARESSGLTVEGRLKGTSTFFNLLTAPIDLTSFAGQTKNFEIRITAAAVADVTFKNLDIVVQR